MDLFADFLVTKHGLGAAMRNDPDGRTALHALFLERLVPVLDDLLAAARNAGEQAEGRGEAGGVVGGGIAGQGGGRPGRW